MKKLLLISLAVLLAVSLSITIFPTLPVEAWRIDGHTFNIKAKGQCIYEIPYIEQWEGEVSIVVAGEKSIKIPGYRGRGYTPRAEVGGHISGSFGPHKIQIGLQGNGVWDFSDQLIRLHGLKLNGNCDGKAISTGGVNRVYVYGDEGSRTIEVILSLSSISPHPLHIYISEATADVFKVNIR